MNKTKKTIEKAFMKCYIKELSNSIKGALKYKKQKKTQS